MTLLRILVPKQVPAKHRLKAMCRELAAMIDALPEPVCVALERSGVVASWHMQLGSLQVMSDKLGAVGSAASSAVELARMVQKMVTR
jgi:hypothetical protein